MRIRPGEPRYGFYRQSSSFSYFCGRMSVWFASRAGSVRPAVAAASSASVCLRRDCVSCGGVAWFIASRLMSAFRFSAGRENRTQEAAATGSGDPENSAPQEAACK